MEYNTIFEPALIVGVSVLGGMLLGTIIATIFAMRNQKELIEELDVKNNLLQKLKETIDNYSKKNEESLDKENIG